MAGAKTGYPLSAVKSPGCHLVLIGFVVNSTSAPTSTFGKGFSVGAPTAGVYTVTLTDGAFPGVYGAHTHLESRTTNSSKRAETRSTANITSGTFTVATQSSAGTDAALSAGEIVWILLALRNTSLT
jgi:hypothetical protein